MQFTPRHIARSPMPHLLIVNDDGIASPMLPAMVEWLRALGAVSIVVPAEEQSWKGKAMTRYGRVEARPSDAFGVPAFAVTGTPSDCVNLALHHLLPEPPDWIVSGINIGSNAGVAFVINSGTVGAALEGRLQGIPSVAFSTYLAPEYFREWSEQRRLSHPSARDIVRSTAERMAAMMATLLAQGDPCPGAVLNVNFPGVVDGATPVRWVPLQDNRYGSVFRRDGEGFVHGTHVGLSGDETRLTDRAVMLRGEISVTPIAAAGGPPAVLTPPL